MKRFTATMLSILVCALILTIAASPVRANIERFTWLPPFLEKGYNNYYDEYVVIYRHGSTVNAIIPVENDAYPNGLNVSKVIINFDWGRNKTLDLSDNIELVEWHETEIFTVSFTASATEAVSSVWAHEYTIYVEHVNATTGPTEVVNTWSRPWNWWGPGYLFVVFPVEQADALNSADEYDAYAGAFPMSSFSGVEAQQLAGQASIEAALGETYYRRGDYSSAKAQYDTALNLYSQALAAEASWRTTSERAELNITLTEAEATMTEANAMFRQADAAMRMAEATVSQSYAWILFGLGFAFMGVATIVYASRKPKAG